jgi:hypothetical protein
MVVYLAVDLLWAYLLKTGGVGASPDVASTWGSFVGLIVSTSGVVLALLQVFGSGQFAFSLRLATISLVLSVVLGMLLFGLVVSAAPEGASAKAFRAFVFNLTLWTFGLGLFSIGWALIYR